jgi:hypothetical protein
VDAIKFFESDALQLPLRRDAMNDHDFEDFLKRVFSNYLAEFDNLRSDDALTKAIKAGLPQAKTMCEDIQETVQQYLCGWPANALSKLKYAIGRVCKHFDRLLPKFDQAHLPVFQALYRIRAISVDELGVEFGRKDLFHIPFERREIVNRQRYSLPGLPCLYLGSSLYVCWKELDGPPFQSLYAAAIRVRRGESITVLDFSITPPGTARFISGAINDLDFAMPTIVARAICWPLLAACSVRRLHRNSPFIAEYIVPQLLLQWVTESNYGRHPDHVKVDGIVYFSVNCDQGCDLGEPSLNFVFPVQEPQPRGQCPVLRRKFEMTDPVNWPLLENCDFGDGVTRNADRYIRLAEKRVRYLDTPFGIVESALSRLDFLQL